MDDLELFEELEEITLDAAAMIKNLDNNQIIKILRSGCLAGVDHRLTDYSIRFNDVYGQLERVANADSPNNPKSFPACQI